MVKKTNFQKYRHLKAFKGILTFTDIDDCVVFYNEKIAGMGHKMKSTGKVFRCLFPGVALQKYAKIMASRTGRVGIKGFSQEDNIYITSIYYPPSRSKQARVLFRKREGAAHAEYIRENFNTNFTGAHRSHETFVPIAAQYFEVKLAKKEKIVKIEPIKRKRKKPIIDEVALAEAKDRREADLAAFYRVRTLFKGTTLRLGMIESGFTVKEIDAALDLINISCQFMSHCAR